MEQSNVRQQGMADVTCVVRRYWNTKLELLIGNVKQGNLEGYNVNLINFNVKKYLLTYLLNGAESFLGR